MRRAAAAGVAVLLLAAAGATGLYGPAGRALAINAALATPTVTGLDLSVERSSAKLVHKRDLEAVCGCHASAPADPGALIWVVAVAGQARFGNPAAPVLTYASGFITLSWPDLHGGGGGFNTVDAWPVFWGRVPDLSWG